MDTIHAAQLQQQLKHNANEAQEFVKELGEWEDEIRQKDESLKKHKPILKQVSCLLSGAINAAMVSFCWSFLLDRNCLLLEDKGERRVAGLSSEKSLLSLL